MEENKVVEKAIEEIKGADEASLKEFVESWFEKTRTDGMYIGAKFISAAVAGTIEKHLKKGTKPSLRSYERCINEILKIVSVQLNQQKDLENMEEDVGGQG